MMFTQLLEFVGNHWVLFIALAVVVGLLIQNIIVGSKGVVDPSGATELINRRDATVIDVRASADFAKGHIMNAVNIPMNGFKNQMAVLNKYRDKPIVVSCHSGNQSQLACILLRKAGFPEVYNLRGGVMAWQNANLPLTRK